MSFVGKNKSKAAFGEKSEKKKKCVDVLKTFFKVEVYLSVKKSVVTLLSPLYKLSPVATSC